jgi:hypothetical protein
MTALGESDERRIGERVFYCEKHGVLNRSVEITGSMSEIAKHTRHVRSE